MLLRNAGHPLLPTTDACGPTVCQLARRRPDVQRGVDIERAELERRQAEHRGLARGDAGELALDDEFRGRLDEGVQLLDLVHVRRQRAVLPFLALHSVNGGTVDDDCLENVAHTAPPLRCRVDELAVRALRVVAELLLM